MSDWNCTVSKYQQTLNIDTENFIKLRTLCSKFFELTILFVDKLGNDA